MLDDIAMGESIAVNGCCLTVVGWGPTTGDRGGRPTWSTRPSPAPASASSARVDPVNLERPVRLQDRLGGHLVQGHVDGVGEIVDRCPDLQVRTPAELLRYVVEKGSITVDGVSLTVVEPLDDGFTVAVIPHTAEVTTLGRKGPGDPVNLEVDVIAKYAERLLVAHVDGPDSGAETRRGTRDPQQAGLDPKASPPSPRPSPPSGGARSSSSSTTRTARTRATSSWRPSPPRPRRSRSSCATPRASSARRSPASGSTSSTSR